MTITPADLFELSQRLDTLERLIERLESRVDHVHGSVEALWRVVGFQTAAKDLDQSHNTSNPVEPSRHSSTTGPTSPL